MMDATEKIEKQICEAIEKDFELETIVENSDKKYATKFIKIQQERSEKFSALIKAFTKAKDKKRLLTVLRFFGNKNIVCPLVNEDTVHEQKKCESQKEFLADVQNDVARLQVEKAEKLFESATSDNPTPYKFRNRWLEKTINILIKLCKYENNDFIWQYDSVKKSWEIYLLISECYLRRGRSILPKGKGLAPPEKKMEAFEKALNWIDKALKENQKETETETETEKKIINYKVWILDELLRLGDRSWDNELKLTSQKAITAYTSFSPKTDPLDFFVLSVYCRFNDDPGSHEILFNADITENDLGIQSVNLIKAKSAFYLLVNKKKNCDNNVIVDQKSFEEIMKSTLNEMNSKELYLTEWDDLIALLNEIKTNNTVNGLQDWAYEAWKICRGKEEELSFGLEIRQYWSRLSGLYDLAYQGVITSVFKKNCEKLEKAAEIMDSVKGRTSLTWGEMDNLLKGCPDHRMKSIKEQRERYFVNESQLAMNEFTIGHNDLKNKIKKLPQNSADKNKQTKREPLNIKTIPKGWAAVHLYVNNIKQCDAVICINNQNKNSLEWSYYKFTGTEILKKYNKWLKKYRQGKASSINELTELCKTIGSEMAFLFDVAEEVNGIIFIPHSFTHLLPLHAAKQTKSDCDSKSDNYYLFEKVCCTYLPAWSLINVQDISEGRDISESSKITNNSYCLRAYPNREEEEQYFKEYYNDTLSSLPEKNKINKATGQDFAKLPTKFNGTPPEWLIFLCHGKVNEMHPFKSALKLCDSDLSLLEILSSELDLTGSKIMMNSCETELAVKGKSVVDEHLTIASSFLTKKASLVLGAMWEISEFPTREIMEEALNSNAKPLWEILKEKQKKWIKNSSRLKYWPEDSFSSEWETRKLYYIAPFRILGYPFIRNNRFIGSAPLPIICQNF